MHIDFRYDTCEVLTNFLGQNLLGREAYAYRGMFWQPFDGATNSLKTFAMVLKPKDFDRKTAFSKLIVSCNFYTYIYTPLPHVADAAIVPHHDPDPHMAVYEAGFTTDYATKYQ